MRIHEVDGAGHTGVEGVDGAQNLHRLIGDGQRRADEGHLVGPGLILVVARRGVPRRRDDLLVVADLPVVDDDPVAEAAARGLHRADPLRVLGPGGGVPLLAVEGLVVARLDVLDERLVVLLHLVHEDDRLQCAGGGAAQRGEEGLDGCIERLERGIDQLLRLRIALGVEDEHACQRADLHRVLLPARGLEPGVLLLHGEEVVGRRGATVVEVGLALPRVQPFLVALAVLVPGVGDELLDLPEVLGIDFVDGGEIASQDGTRRDAVRAGGIGLVLRQFAPAQEVAQPLTQRGVVQIVGRDGEEVGEIDLLDEGLHLVDRVADDGEHVGVERHVAVGVDGEGDAADDEVGVRVLAAEDGVNLDEVGLGVQRLQVVRHRKEVDLRRELVGGMAPVGIGEDAQLAAVYQCLDLVLDTLEIAR